MSDRPIGISLLMNERDFTRMYDESFRWGEQFRDAFNEIGTYETTTMTPLPLFTWKYAYRLSKSWTDVMIARAFLATFGCDCEVIYELPSPKRKLLDDGAYVVLTNYASPSWRDREAQERTNG